MLFKIETVIDRDIFAVYDFLTNLERLPWQTHPFVKEYTKMTGGSFNVGARYKETFIYRKWKIEIITEVINYDKPTKIEYSWTGKQMKGTLKYNLKETNNKTFIRQTQTLFLAGFLKMFNPIIYIIFRKRITERLESIKFLLDNKMEGIKSFAELI